jgi:hypothetical protein
MKVVTLSRQDSLFQLDIRVLIILLILLDPIGKLHSYRCISRHGGRHRRGGCHPGALDLPMPPNTSLLRCAMGVSPADEMGSDDLAPVVGPWQASNRTPSALSSL